MDNRKISELSSNNDINPPKNPLKSTVKMPPETETSAPAPKIKAEPKPAKVITAPAPVVAAKPMVEGINSPKTSSEVVAVRRPDFTEQEKQLISETDSKPQTFKEPKARLMPESVVNRQGRPQTHFKAMFFTLVILLALIFAGYEFYSWELEKSAVQGTQNNYSPITGQNNPENSTTSTSTLPNGSTASTSSSSLGSIPFPLAGGTPPATGTPATTTPQATPTLKLKITSTPTGYLNVRSEPSTSGQIIAKVHPGETYPYTSTKPGWYFISLPNASYGWISSQYVALQ